MVKNCLNLPHPRHSDKKPHRSYALLNTHIQNRNSATRSPQHFWALSIQLKSKHATWRARLVLPAGTWQLSPTQRDVTQNTIIPKWFIYQLSNFTVVCKHNGLWFGLSDRVISENISWGQSMCSMNHWMEKTTF